MISFGSQINSDLLLQSHSVYRVQRMVKGTQDKQILLQNGITVQYQPMRLRVNFLKT